MLMLSIIIPVYNTGRYLEKCVTSILMTSFDSYEIIIVDDGSTDDSLSVAQEIVQRNFGKIRVIHQANQGLGGARDTGINAASGKYLFFIDSDDYLAPHALDRIAEAFSADFDIAIFDAIQVDEKGKEIQKVCGCHNRQMHTLSEFPELLFEYPAAWNKIIEKSFMISTNIFYPTNVWFEDLSTISKLYLHAKKILYIPEPLYCYVMRKGSIMNSSICKRNLEIINVITDVVGYYKSQGKYEAFCKQLEYMAFKHELITTTTRVNQIDPRSEVQLCLRENFFSQFPHYRENPYVMNAPWKEKMILCLISHGQYQLLHFIMTLNKTLKKRKS